MNIDVPILAAFVAGMVSITSPCVLPLLPLYLAHLAGVSSGQNPLTARQRMIANAVAFVLGFSLVFIAMGAALGAAGMLVQTSELVAGNRFWLVRIGGVLLIALGLNQLGLLRIPWLDRERSLTGSVASTGHLTSSFLVGMTFGAGWSPCVGPILGAILTMAAGQGSIDRAVTLLAVYSAGLAVPFLAVAFASGSSARFVKSINRRLGMASSLSGGVMLAVGAIMVLGLYQQFFARIVALSPWVPWEPTI